MEKYWLKIVEHSNCKISTRLHRAYIFQGPVMPKITAKFINEELAQPEKRILFAEQSPAALRESWTI